MANSSTGQSQSNQISKGRKMWKFLIPAFFSILVGFFPSIMPDSIKTKLVLLLGSNYEIIWTVVFVSISALLIWFSYLLWKTEEKSKSGTNIEGVISGNSTKISSKKEDDFSAKDIKSGKNTELNISHDGGVDINKIESKEDTIIEINNSK